MILAHDQIAAVQFEVAQVVRQWVAGRVMVVITLRESSDRSSAIDEPTDRHLGGEQGLVDAKRSSLRVMLNKENEPEILTLSSFQALPHFEPNFVAAAVGRSQITEAEDS